MGVIAWLAALMTAALQASGAPAEEKSKSAYVEPQDGERPALPAADLKSLRETNIFSPYKPKRVPPPPIDKNKTPKTPPVPRKPKPPIVTGILLDPVTKAYQVVVEDRNETSLKLLKAPVFLKAGDEVLVYKLESVTALAATFRHGEVLKEIRVGDSLPDAGLKAPEGAEPAPLEEGEPTAEPKTDAKPSESSSSSGTPTLDEATRKKILEERIKKLGKKRKTDEEN